LPRFGVIAGLGILGMCVALRTCQMRVELAIGLIAMHVTEVLLVYNFGRFLIGRNSHGLQGVCDRFDSLTCGGVHDKVTNAMWELLSVTSSESSFELADAARWCVKM
jgi:hypothetical protein